MGAMLSKIASFLATRRRRDPVESPSATPDDVTTDRVLKGLRRQRRVQLEEGEKDRLRSAITRHNRLRDAQSIRGRGPSILQERTGLKLQKPRDGFLKKGDIL